MQNSNSWPIIRYWNIEQRNCCLQVKSNNVCPTYERGKDRFGCQSWSVLVLLYLARAEFLVVFFTMISFSLWLFYSVLINTNWELKIRNNPFRLVVTWNLAFSLFFYCLYFYFSERAESNEKFFSRNQEVILSASLVGFCLIVIVGVMLYLFKRRVLLRQKT